MSDGFIVETETRIYATTYERKEGYATVVEAEWLPDGVLYIHDITQVARQDGDDQRA